MKKIYLLLFLSLIIGINNAWSQLNSSVAIGYQQYHYRYNGLGKLESDSKSLSLSFYKKKSLKSDYGIDLAYETTNSRKEWKTFRFNFNYRYFLGHNPDARLKIFAEAGINTLIAKFNTYYRWDKPFFCSDDFYNSNNFGKKSVVMMGLNAKLGLQIKPSNQRCAIVPQIAFETYNNMLPSMSFSLKVLYFMHTKQIKRIKSDTKE